MSAGGMKISTVCVALVAIAFAMIYAERGHSYLLLGSANGGNFTVEKWSTVPVPIQISTKIVSGAKLSGNTSFQTVIMNSLATWNQAPNFQTPLGAPTTNTFTSPQNGVNLICFCASGGNFDGADGTLAVTVTTSNGSQIIGANIFFNPQPTGVCFVTDGNVSACPNSADAVQDLQTVATHEIGHFIGMDHSPVVRAVMFPFAPDKQTELGWDDVAAASVLYPKSSADVATGAIAGKVTLSGGAVFGAHVFANSTSGNNPFSAFPNIRKTPIGMLTDTAGNYTIQGVPPDTYQIFAEPLDGPADNSNVDWASDFGQGSVQTNFTTRAH